MSIPLRGTVKVEPFLGRRCLHKALSVVQFSTVLKIADPDGVGVAPFQEALRDKYPILEQQIQNLVQLNVTDREILQQLQKQTVWRLLDIEKKWRVTLTSQSIAIECDHGYQNRYDFAERNRFIIEAVWAHFKPAQSIREGTRFVNLAPSAEIVGQCAPQLVSVTGEPDLVQADLSWRFSVDEGSLLLRSGIYPAGASYEPALVEPLEERTWFLDIDVFNDESVPYDVERLSNNMANQTNRAHAIYIWAMTNSKKVEVGETQ